MATLEQQSEVFTRSIEKLKQAKEEKILNDEYIEKFGSLYTHNKIISKMGNNTRYGHLINPEPEDYLAEMETHIVFLDSLLKLKKAIDDPNNNPRKMSEIRDSKDPEAKKMALQLNPNLKKMLIQAVKAIETSHGISTVERQETLAFLTASLNNTTVLVNEISKPTDKDKCVKMQNLLNNTKAITKGKIAKICLKNPALTEFVAKLLGVTAIILFVVGIKACFFPGIVVGLPMMAAAAGLGWMIGRLMDLSHTGDIKTSRTKGALAEYADSLTKFVNSDKVYTAFEKSETAIEKAAKLSVSKTEKPLPEPHRPIVPRRIM